jgi:hypothetical protein
MAPLVVLSALEGSASANAIADEAIPTAGTIAREAMLRAVRAALDPIGMTYFAAYGSAQTNNRTAALRVGGVHNAIGAATESSRAPHFVADNV